MFPKYIAIFPANLPKSAKKIKVCLCKKLLLDVRSPWYNPINKLQLQDSFVFIVLLKCEWKIGVCVFWNK